MLPAMAQGTDVVFTGAYSGRSGRGAMLFGCDAGLFIFKERRKDAQPEQIMRPAGWSAMQKLDEGRERLLGSMVPSPPERLFPEWLSERIK